MSDGELCRLRPLAVASAAILLLAGCASPSPTMSDYQTKTRTTASAVAGIAAVARTGAQQWQHGRLTKAYADTLITEAEDDAGSIIATYDSRQPPTSDAIALKNKIDKPLQDVSNALTDLRIALRRGDHQGVTNAVRSLVAPHKKLSGMEQVGL